MGARTGRSTVFALPVLVLGVLGVLWALLETAGHAHGQSQPITVAAAANLRPALEEIVPLFEKSKGRRVRLVYGSTGNLYRQIAQGAPFELFLAADAAHPGRLVEEGHTQGRSAVYARGRLAIIVRKGLGQLLDKDATSLTWLAASSDIKRFAIANPEHAPYGEAAKSLLTRRGVWPHFSAMMVYGENVSQTAQYVASGAADAAIVAASLLATPGLLDKVDAAVLPPDAATRLEQAMVVLKRARPEAQQLYDFLLSAEVQAVLARHNYVPGRGTVR